ncbi:uracil-DNA glycosylase family protein [Motiliproteus sp.]|uniref:uracil-DNA glycosylase family protein n=1 Tax=Motiliproteus sp. TaxID=1898955 RepID=UPI003BAA5107
MTDHMIESWQQLLEDVKACRQCQADLPFEPRPILQFDPRARILLAGQAPGRITHERGIPFDDPSGERLRAWLGLDRQQFYDPSKLAILPMGFCYPGRGRSGDLPPRPECALRWREPLMEQLTQLRMILLLGKYAQDYHLQDRRSLSERVADWKEAASTDRPQIICLPHPSPRNQHWIKQRPWFEAELLPWLRQQVASYL